MGEKTSRKETKKPKKTLVEKSVKLRERAPEVPLVKKAKKA